MNSINFDWGKKEVLVTSTGAEKQRFTSLFAISAANDFLPLFIMFKAKNVPRDVLALQNGGLKPMAGTPAWMGPKSFGGWIGTVWTSYPKRFTRALLVMDRSRVHTHPQILQRFSELNTDTPLTPPGLTYYAQPLDVYVNGPVKRKLRECWEEYMVNTQPNATTGNLILTNLIFL